MNAASQAAVEATNRVRKDGAQMAQATATEAATQARQASTKATIDLV